MANTPQQADPKPNTYLMLSEQRYEFYRKYYHQSLGVIACLFILLIGLVGFIFYQRAARVTPRYFPTTPDARLIEMPALTKPYISDRTVIEWVKGATIVVNALDYVNYKRALQEARHYFTPGGYAAFMKAFDESNNLTAIRKKRQTLSVKILSEPKIIKSGLIGNQEQRYAWFLKFPVEFIYENSLKEISSQRLMASVLVVRAQTLAAPPFGIALHQFIVEAI